MIMFRRTIKYLSLFFIILLTACSITVNETSPSPVTTESASIYDERSLIWIVEPTLSYEWISYCGKERIFKDDKGTGIDVKTGKESDDVCWGHGGFRGTFLYDESKDSFGMAGGFEGEANFEMYPVSEFELKFPDLVNQVHICYGVDSTKVKLFEGWDGYDISEALTGKCAVTYGNKPVSDFIYDSGEVWGARLFNNIIAVQKNSKWGLIDKDGNIVVPFVLDHAVSIDNTTAFAKYEGKYGILSIPILDE